MCSAKFNFTNGCLFKMAMNLIDNLVIMSLFCAGLEPLKAILHMLGGWPVLEGPSWSDPDFKWYVGSSYTQELNHVC
jgi:hypothetical protein